MTRFTMWSIVALSIQVTLLSIALSKTLYNLGYSRGLADGFKALTETEASK